METALRDMSSTVELLAVAAQSDAVARWDEAALRRAFDWARHCERLLSTYHDKPSARSAMERQLQRTNQSLQTALPGHVGVSLSDLSRCQHLLLAGLLNNHHLPSSIMKLLFDSRVPADGERPDDVTGRCSLIIRRKSACHVLRPAAGSSAAGADADVQGTMLMQRLDVLVSQGAEDCRTRHFLDSVLRGCHGSAEHFCAVIAASLLTAAETASQDALLDWLLEKDSMLRHMCSALPAALLTDLVKKHEKFRDAYFHALKQWAFDMEYSISDGEWVPISTDAPTVSFQKLTEHFLALFDTCPSLKEDVVNELNALKISDGDFDVRGLSVWGDLLSALK